MSDLGRRFIACFVRAADDAGLPEDPEFRAVLRAYLEWAVGEVIVYGPPGHTSATRPSNAALELGGTTKGHHVLKSECALPRHIPSGAVCLK